MCYLAVAVVALDLNFLIVGVLLVVVVCCRCGLNSFLCLGGKQSTVSYS